LLLVSIFTVSSLPDDIGRSLPALEKLSAPYNNIETLPDSFSLLIGLKSLELIGNKFLEVPAQLKNVKVVLICYASLLFSMKNKRLLMKMLRIVFFLICI
jgi:Leucine-rich repeat (LRR) protein